MQRILISTILAALLAGAAVPALAQQAADVTVSHLGYQLIDLAPDDGIAPSLAWTSEATLAYTHVYDQEGIEIDGVQIESLGSAGFANGYAAMQVDAQSDAAHINLDLISGYGFADANRSFRFMLSPHTQVIFSIDADLSADATPAQHDTLSALAELYGSLHDVGADDLAFYTRAQVDQGSQHGILSVSAASQNTWVDGIVAMNAYAVAESHALPVPEPQTSLMLLCGIAMLGLVSRKRHG
jgi:hypothetical protein